MGDANNLWKALLETIILYHPLNWCLLLKQICVICEHWWFVDQRRDCRRNWDSFPLRDNYVPPFPKIFIKSRYKRHKPEISQYTVRLIEGQRLCFILAFYLSLQLTQWQAHLIYSGLFIHCVSLCVWARTKKKERKKNRRAGIWTKGYAFYLEISL